MKLPPFVIGTDLTQLSRWDPNIGPARILGIARRLLHPIEFQGLVQKYPGFSHLVRKSTPPPRSEIDKIFATQLGPDSVLKDEARKHGALLSGGQEGQALEVQAGQRIKQALAGRWAAKEAAKKAWGASIVSWKDLTVHFAAGGDQPGKAGGGLEVVLCPFNVERPNAVFDYMRDVRMKESESPHRNDGGAKVSDGSMEDLSKGSSLLGGETGACSAEVGDDGILVQRGRLSISHDGDYCVATVLAEPLHPEIRTVLEKRWQSSSRTRRNKTAA